ncbi:MAG TPA: Holliday junction branch migration protein RuvA [Ferruginibacter sp.]|nr:Holliday junction branch migration protein RuvA [Ferruginibacter sp.]HRO06349.1 Holliday junction branch migration protein RuvA [Ferruginibacter sp.]HRO97098.1 Holliday junction branch migration protein RuvA [Ferruginibacter sp.]HRP50352.1 Holliday junction branch migration protein RuvA [Ferruginibacter sp.]
MYAYLNGQFTFKSPALIHIDINGIGFEVNISLHTYASIQDKSSGKIYTWLQVKEDGNVLYGFADPVEKDIFLQLISVSGVGAATARMMLSYIRPEEVVKAIQQGNVKLLESVKGIGKKTAERLVLELRDKVAKWAAGSDEQPKAVGNPQQLDAVQALMALGIAKNMAEQAVQKVIKQEPQINHLEDLIKKALKAI